MVSKGSQCLVFLQNTLPSIVRTFCTLLANAIASLKSIPSIVTVGIVALTGGTKISDPYANFHDIFSGSTTNPNSLATALVETNMSFYGYQNAFNLITEVRGRDPVKVARRAGSLSLWLVAFLYLFTNVTYVAIIPAHEIAESGQLVAALMFQRVFGDGVASKLLPLMVACSCLGNIVSNILSLF